MRTLILCICAILFSAAAAHAQTAQSVNVGYAVITPATPSTTGLVAFENLMLTRSQTDTLEVGVFPPNLMLRAQMPIDRSAADSSTLGVAITNPNNALANITMSIRRTDGSLLTTSTFTISGRRQIARLLTEYFPATPSGGFSNQVPVPAEFTGTLQVVADIPVSIVGLKFRGLNFSTVPLIDLAATNSPVPAIILGVGGLGSALFPQFVVGGGWASEFVIQNTSGNSLTIRLDLFTTEGVPMNVVLNGQTGSSFTNLLVPATGLLTLAPTAMP